MNKRLFFQVLMERGEDVIQLGLRVHVYLINEIRKGLVDLVIKCVCEDMNLSVIYVYILNTLHYSSRSSWLICWMLVGAAHFVALVLQLTFRC